MSFNLDDYVDVAERISQFYATYPKGALKTGSQPQFVETGGKAFVVYHAQAFRTPEDPLPADGWAWEPVPGPTQFTKDSELQNAETAAWGRAIVALGFETKKIASREEVQNRSGAAEPPGNGRDNPSRSDEARSPAPDNPAAKAQAAQEAAKVRRTPDDDGKPENVVLTFGKHKGSTIGNAPRAYVEWLAEKYEPKTPEQRRIHTAAVLVTSPAADPYPDIPF